MTELPEVEITARCDQLGLSVVATATPTGAVSQDVNQSGFCSIKADNDTATTDKAERPQCKLDPTRDVLIFTWNLKKRVAAVSLICSF